MAFDIPDGPQPSITVEVVEAGAITPEPATEYAIDSYGSTSTASASYQTVKTWTVTADRMGILRAVEIACDRYDVAEWKLVVGDVTVFEDITLPVSFTKGLPDLKLASETTVTLSVKSDGVVTINAYADFDAKEVG